MKASLITNHKGATISEEETFCCTEMERVFKDGGIIRFCQYKPMGISIESEFSSVNIQFCPFCAEKIETDFKKLSVQEEKDLKAQQLEKRKQEIREDIIKKETLLQELEVSLADKKIMFSHIDPKSTPVHKLIEFSDEYKKLEDKISRLKVTIANLQRKLT